MAVIQTSGWGIKKLLKEYTEIYDTYCFDDLVLKIDNLWHSQKFALFKQNFTTNECQSNLPLLFTVLEIQFNPTCPRGSIKIY